MPCTIVSLLPFEIVERKVGLYPGEFVIPKGDINKGEVSVTHIPNCFYNVPTSDNRSFRTPELAETVGNSIINDWVTAQLGYGEDAFPGLFLLDGVVSETDVLSKHASKVEAARVKQNNWFAELIRIADDDWQRHHQHKQITALQRMAAQQLGLDREWSKVTTQEVVVCPFCTSVIPKAAVVCLNCHHVVDEKAYKQLNPTKVGA